MLHRLKTCCMLVALGLCPAHADAALRMTPLELPGHAQPSISTDGRGGFVLTSIERQGSRAELRFHQLDRQGQLQHSGLIASGSDWFVNWADFPSLVVADNGDWLSFYLRKSDPSKPYAYDIWTTRSTDRGQTWSEASRLNQDNRPTEHGFVSLLPDGEDRVLAIWLDGRRGAEAGSHAGHDDHGAAHTSLRSAQLSRDGSTQQVELDDLTCDCCHTDALRTEQGPWVVYRDRSREEIRDIGWLRRFDHGWSAPAIAVADHWQMAGCPVNGPALTRLGDRPLLAWPTQNGANFELRLAVHAQSGWQPLTRLEAHPSLLGRVDAAPWHSERALVSWLGVAEGTAGHPVLRVAELDGNGEQISRLDITELPVGRNTGMPRLASLGDAAILVWTEPGAAGPRVRGVRIETDATISDD
ncbi:sialidase family protein [Pseudomarimonas arenosa]|uniref:Exo-alpha-sialidase n=1 Tax=Pseudomarimonas arenosa TaxID=2774145 RepID=A0AAW3ZDP9_9GAMM|nr:sialidase family protein [Pseudomarimonas arenosa]MBD8524311.1 exo-alpha-sialidase [Pseudomarimonas arenosa]